MKKPRQFIRALILKNLVPRYQLWTWGVIAAFILMCVLVVFQHFRQQQLLREMTQFMTTMHMARIELAKGFLYASLSDDPGAPFSREEGLTLLRQAANSLETSMNVYGDIMVPSETQEFQQSLNIFQSRLEEYNAETATQPELETNLRIAFHKLEQHTDHVDLENQERLQQLASRLNFEFGLTLAGATFLALCVSVVMVLSNRVKERADADLQEREQKLNKLLDILPVGISILDAERKVAFSNPAMKEILHITEEELASDMYKNRRYLQTDGTLMPAEQFASTQAIQTGLAVFGVETGIIKEDNEIIWTSVSAVPVGFPDWKTVVVTVNITERKKAEDNIRKLNERFAEIAENIPDIFWVAEPVSRRNLYLSPAFQSIIGQSVESVSELPNGFLDVIVPEDRHILLEARKHENLGMKTDSLYRILRPDGSIRWIRDKGLPIYGENERVARVVGVARDITDQMEAEMRMRESETRFRQLADHIEAVFWMFDIQSQRIIYVSPAYETIWDRSRKALYENHADYILPILPEDQHIMLEGMKKQFAGETSDLEYRIQRSDGSIRWIWDRSFPIFNAEGNLIRTAGVATDITEVKTSREKLEELNRTLEEKVDQRTAEVQDLYDNAPTGYHSIDSNGNYVLVNQTELNWLGYTREEMIGRAAQELLPEESREIFRKEFPLFLQRGWIKNLELNFMRKDGSRLPVSLNATALYDKSGKFVMSRSTIFDITERKQAERVLHENEEQNRLLFEESPIPIALLDETGHIIRINRAYEKLAGIPRSDLYGKTTEEMGMVDPEVTAHLTEAMIEAMSRQENFALVEHFLTNANGTKRIVESRIFILQINSANHILVTTSDISTHKKAEETLRRANIELEHAMLMKDEFLATMSHELRTPLTGILGLSEALQLEIYGWLNEKQVKTIKNIENSGRHLLELINDILDLSKVEAGKLELQVTHCSLEEICQASLHLTKGMAHQKHQQISYFAPVEPILLDVDSRRIKQIIVNLISNAIKFTPENGELGLTIEPDEANRQVRLIVWDKGIGIKTEHLSKLFRPFTQIDGSLAREYSGTGLGLALVRRLVELHNGRVEVESVFGEGSRFTVTLPWTSEMMRIVPPGADDEESRNGLVDENVSHPLILIADDNQVLLDMLTDFLEAKNYRTATAQNGNELLEKIEGIKPDAILMDIQMPGMDGLETIRRIRNHKNAVISSTPIIAVTALAMSGDHERCLEAGANNYVSKPVKLKDLLEILGHLTRGRT